MKELPMRRVRGQCSASNDDMDIRMEGSITRPGLIGHKECSASVKYGVENLLHGFCDRLEKDAGGILGLTVENNSIFMRQREFT